MQNDDFQIAFKWGMKRVVAAEHHAKRDTRQSRSGKVLAWLHPADSPNFHAVRSGMEYGWRIIRVQSHSRQFSLHVFTL